MGPHCSGFFESDFAEVNELFCLFKNKVHSPIPVYNPKANFGHTEASSGLLSLIVSVLCISKRYIPPLCFSNLHPEFQSMSTLFSFSNQGKCKDIKSVLINNYGMTGSHGQILLEFLSR